MPACTREHRLSRERALVRHHSWKKRKEIPLFSKILQVLITLPSCSYGGGKTMFRFFNLKSKTRESVETWLNMAVLKPYYRNSQFRFDGHYIELVFFFTKHFVMVSVLQWAGQKFMCERPTFEIFIFCIKDRLYNGFKQIWLPEKRFFIRKRH